MTEWHLQLWYETKYYPDLGIELTNRIGKAPVEVRLYLYSQNMAWKFDTEEEAERAKQVVRLNYDVHDLRVYKREKKLFKRRNRLLQWLRWCWNWIRHPQNSYQVWRRKHYPTTNEAIRDKRDEDRIKRQLTLPEGIRDEIL